MAKPEPLGTDAKVERSVRRTLANGTLLLGVLAVVSGWAWLGVYQLAPGQAAVLLRFGKHYRTVLEEGLHWTLPPPIVVREVVDARKLRNEDFGFRGPAGAGAAEGEAGSSLGEATMQTGDNNMVWAPFAVQFRIKEPFENRYRIANPDAVVRDAAQAAMREVVGRMTVDGVLRERRALVASDTATLLQDILDSYQAGIEIDKVQLQDVQAPEPVRGSFTDVVAAAQDANRLVNEAEGYRNEVLPKARAEAAELLAAAQGYREARVAEATGEATRFRALAAEYRQAPEVTRKRLYLETMEQVLPNVEKVVIEPGTTQVLPYLPLRGSDGARP
jgi:membrane protease subunit HflK